jgi:glycosyltransferase involved in cell wall biosynthesis
MENKVKVENSDGKALSQSKVLVLGEFAGAHETLLTKYSAERATAVAFIEVLPTRYYKPGMDFLRVSCYRTGNLERSFSYGSNWGFLLRFRKTRKVLLYTLDILYLIMSLARLRCKFDICLACNVPFPLVGLTLRKLRLVRKVIFVSATHFPRNIRLFRFIDKIGQNACDAVWYQTKRMQEVKAEEGLLKNKDIPRILVPIGVDVRSKGPNNRIERRTVGYVGRLDKDMGLDLVIHAFSEAVKIVPDAKFVIIGSGPSEKELKEEAQMLGLTDNVEFKGFIGERKTVEEILSRWAAGIVPYIPVPGDPMYYADSSKVKEYIQAGIPIVITRVPEVAVEIEEETAGFAVEYDKDEVAKAIIRFLTDDSLWQECRENTTHLAFKYNYRELYENAFLGSGIKL